MRMASNFTNYDIFDLFAVIHFINSASENPALWTGMKDASAESRKKETRC